MEWVLVLAYDVQVLDYDVQVLAYDVQGKGWYVPEEVDELLLSSPGVDKEEEERTDGNPRILCERILLRGS